MNRLHIYANLPERKGQCEKGQIIIINQKQKLVKKYEVSIKCKK